MKTVLTRAIISLIICTNIFGLSKYTKFESDVKEAYGWYTMPKANGERPTVPNEASYIEKYDAHFLGKDEKVLYLTFDAGYANENVEKILDTLKEKGVKGTFFLNGGIFKYESDVVKRIANEGHLVCNHTENHLNMCNVKDEEKYKYELEKVEERYKETTGKDMPKIVRPPMGEFDEYSLSMNKKLGYKTVFWSLAYADWDNNKQPSKEYAIKTVMGRTHNGAVILLHPTSKTNAEILGTLIDNWKKDGFEFKTVDEL